MTDIINAVIELVRSIFITPIVNIINSIKDYFNDLSVYLLPEGIREFCGACISLFVPVPALLLCMSLLVPYFTMILTIKIVLRVKSFVPSMGGK